VLHSSLARSVALSFLLCWGSPAWPQTSVDENEKRIATLPVLERTYERFRFWYTQFPPDQQEGDLYPRYRVYLSKRGFSAAEIESQIKILQDQGTNAEVQRWNRILTSETPTFNTKPNEFLVEITKGRRTGTALDVGMGQGRNAIWLAQQGWKVTGFDPAEKAVAVARQTAAKLGLQIQTEIKGEETFDFGENRWDLILLSYVGGREFPSGLLIIEGFHQDATKGDSIGGSVVFATGELPPLFPELRVLRYEEPVTQADFGQQRVRVVRYAGVRPE
jgi:SAM-dependent methyltransferase